MKVAVNDAEVARWWPQQVRCYPQFGSPGITYFAGVRHDGVVDCLLWRDEDGRVGGILNHYPTDFPPFERAGNLCLWVAPGWQRRGIGRALLTEANRRWTIDFDQQLYTRGGLALASAYLAAQASASPRVNAQVRTTSLTTVPRTRLP